MGVASTRPGALRVVFCCLTIMGACGGSTSSSSGSGGQGQGQGGRASGASGGSNGAASGGASPQATGGAGSGGTTVSSGGVAGGASATGGSASGGNGTASGGATGAGGTGTSTGGGTGAMPGGTGGAAGTGGAGTDAGRDGALDGGSPDSHDGGGSGGSSATTTCSASLTLRSGETTKTVKVGNTTRSFILHVPTSYKGTAPVPLVLDFHGIGGSANGEKSDSGYLQQSDQQGFIVAFPQGIDNAWNIGQCCTLSRSVDDLGFAKAIVNAVAAEGCIDPKRVYSVGFSMGGGMSYYLACNAADVFAAIAPSSFDLFSESEMPCTPSRPISVLSFRGTSDSTVPYAGGASMPPNGLNVTNHFRGAKATLQKWVAVNQCTGSATTRSDGCEIYSMCKDGTEAGLCTIQGGGHVPYSAQTGWNFLKAHPLP